MNVCSTKNLDITHRLSPSLPPASVSPTIPPTATTTRQPTTVSPCSPSLSLSPCVCHCDQSNCLCYPTISLHFPPFSFASTSTPLSFTNYQGLTQESILHFKCFTCRNEIGKNNNRQILYLTIV